jgi:predicted metal-dependent enzyme (double-stranded beta helix superfamily)
MRMVHCAPVPDEFHRMAKHMQHLKALRDIAFDFGVGEHPDLASMARELSRMVHQNRQSLNGDLSDLRTHNKGFERWLVALRSKPAISVLVMAWPANHATPIHDHGGLWGLELALHGALEVQSWERGPQGSALKQVGSDWLGPGDASWFDADDHYAHRCRNLSRHETALTLHVYGGDLAQYFTYEKTGETGQWLTSPQRSALAGHLRA